MDIDSGKLYTNTGDEFEQFKKLKEQMSAIEIHEDDLTEKEKQDKQVDLTGNTKAARHARYFRNMRRFIQQKQGRQK